MPIADLRKKFVTKNIHRGTQVILGERKHLEEVLRSVQKARISAARKRTEMSQLKKLIAARTGELNQINSGWDRKFKKARDPKTTPRELLWLAINLPPDDYLLARVLTEHAEAPAELLEHLAAHPYSAVRENVARHPRTPAQVLRRMAEDAREPLWFLVACNPSTPQDLREALRARMRPSGDTPTGGAS
ncbi:MAG: hypothetical protein ABSB82_18085 [Terriglobia bacterium]|jgi:hypothetical protein